MAGWDRLLTAAELLRMPDDDMWHELVAGRLITMSPPGFAHGICAGRLEHALTTFARRRKLGLVAPQDTGFKLKSDPDTVRAPDVAFVRASRIPRQLPTAYWDGAPDLAVEVLSPREREREVLKKVPEYLECGSTAVWVVRPRTRSVTLFHSGSEPVTLSGDDALTDPRVLPGFRFELPRLFEGIGAPARSRRPRATSSRA
jgi:Uma2 family endonuclease